MLQRAQERLTLKHRNTSKFVRRVLHRGLDLADEGTRAAVAEQLRLGEELRRKMVWLHNDYLTLLMLFGAASGCNQKLCEA